MFQSTGLLGPSTVSLLTSTKDVPETLFFGQPTLLVHSNSEPLIASTSTIESEPVHNASESIGSYVNTTQPSASASSYIPRRNIQATTFDGRTVFFKRKSKPITNSACASASTSSQRTMSNLLDIPIHRLMDRLSSNTARRIANCEQNRSVPTVSTTSKPVEDLLWVDRYRPRKFTELVGNEKVARDVMTWIKQWDHCVFGKSRGTKRSRDEGEENVIYDQYHRPPEKMLLLSGPPGLGKTTMAHVLAKQAGYEVMEINASDARTGNIVDDRIRATLESGSAIGSTKPVLLVIDEIDGATGAGDHSNTFIHKLVQMVNTKPSKKRGKKDPQGPRPILRPIICICNDHNASSLTKLRPYAYQVRFYRPADIHLVKRLKEICQMEGMKADSRALSTLVSAAKGDLRGCLNTLQFIKTRGEDVTDSVVRKATSGMKQADTNYLSVLNNLFSPLTKKQVMDLALSEEDEARYVARLSHEISGSGREANIASGCFGHYATLRRHDANLNRHQQGITWLSTFDTFSSAMYSDGDFALNQYLPYTILPFYPLFQERGGERIERNQADWEHFQQARSNEEILKSLGRCLRTATIRYGGDFRHLLSTPVLQLEFTPYINRIISPPLRPVNSQVIRPTEKMLMNRLVDIMSTLELRFVQDRADDGQLSYRLDPAIDVFITYDGKRAADIMVSRYAVRHLVAGEIEAKLLARDTDIIEKGKRGKHDFFGKPRVNTEPNHADGNAEDATPNKRAKLDVQDIADKPPVDFFGRLISVPSGNGTNTTAKKAEKKFKISYRFLEGNSAAVRKPVKVNSFL